MSDRVFYVGARPQNDEKRITGYVPAKFLTLNGKPVVDPTPGGSQNAYIYADGSDRYKTRGEIANPNNYLIVPANYTEQQARAFAVEIASAVGQADPGNEGGGLGGALGQMTGAFVRNGPQDLQRHPQWGIPKKIFCPGVYRQRILSPWIGDSLGGLTDRLVGDRRWDSKLGQRSLATGSASSGSQIGYLSQED